MLFQPRWGRALLLLALFANDATQAGGGEQAALDVLLTDASGPIRVTVGQTLRIHLAASPAMGYEWVLEEGAFPLLRLEADPDGAERRLHNGKASEHRWEFRAARSGHAALRFVSRRPWEVPSRTVQFDVVVR